MLHSVTAPSSTASLAFFMVFFFCQDFDEIHGTIFSSFFLLNGERLLFGLNGGHVIVLLILAIDDA